MGPAARLSASHPHNRDDNAGLAGIRVAQHEAAVTHGLLVVERGVDDLAGLPHRPAIVRLSRLLRGHAPSSIGWSRFR